MRQIADHRVFSEVTLVGKESPYWLHGTSLHGTVIELVISAANVSQNLHKVSLFSAAVQTEWGVCGQGCLV